MKRKIVDRPSGFEIAASLESFTSEYAYSGSPKTEAFYRNQLGTLRDYLARAGLTLLGDVTADTIRLYLKEQSRSTYVRRGQSEPRTLARSTLIQRYAAARTFFQWCVDEGRLDVSPMVNVKRPKEEHRIREALDREQFRILVQNAAAGPGWIGLRDKAILLLLLDTGARASELLGMGERCIDWRAGQVVLHGKGSKDRVMDLAPETRRAIRAYLQHPKRPKLPGDPVWVTLRRRAMGYGALNAMIHAMEGYAGLDTRVTPHRFRHTFAAEFTRANLGNVKATKERLGHSKIATTERYIESLGGGYGLGESFKTPAASWGIT